MACLTREELEFLIELKEELKSKEIDSPTIQAFNYIVERHIKADKKVEYKRKSRKEQDLEWRKQKRKMKG